MQGSPIILKTMRRFSLLFSAALIAVCSCSGPAPVPGPSLEREMRRTAEARISGERFIEELPSIRLSKSGYFYLVGEDGTVLSHPKSGMRGMNFSDLPFVRAMFGRKAGCMEQEMDGARRIVLFRTLDNGAMLCLTISASDVADITSLRCVRER